MKTFQIAILALAAAFAAGCSPSSPPSGYDSNNSGASGGAFGENIGNSLNESLPSRNDSFGSGSDLFDPLTGQPDPRAVMATIYFGFDRYNVSSAEGNKLVPVAQQGQSARLIVAGYTDHFGTDQYNIALSDKRAQSVKMYLINLGIPESNIEIKAFGKQYARPNGTKEQVREDRRAVVVDANFKP